MQYESTSLEWNDWKKLINLVMCFIGWGYVIGWVLQNWYWPFLATF